MIAILEVSGADRSPPEAPPDLRPLTVIIRPAPPDAIVLTVLGDVDTATSPLLKDYLLPQVRDAVADVVVDLTGVTFFTAAGITVLVDAREAAVTSGIGLWLVASTRPVLLPLTITRVDEIFDISPNINHALLRAGGGRDDDPR